MFDAYTKSSHPGLQKKNRLQALLSPLTSNHHFGNFVRITRSYGNFFIINPNRVSIDFSNIFFRNYVRQVFTNAV